MSRMRKELAGAPPISLSLPGAPDSKVGLVEIDKIKIGRRKRGLSEPKVAELVMSIQIVSLIHAITITETYHLVAGWHRLVACQRLGWKAIPALIVPTDQLLNEQKEIDENLIRGHLTVLERGEHLHQGKEVFKQLCEEAKNNSDPKRNNFVADCSYTEFAANQSDATRRSIQQEIRIANLICGEAKDMIRDQPFANRKVDLIRLSRMGQEDQVRIAKVINAGAGTLDDALALLASKGDPLDGHRRAKSREVKGLEKLLEFASQGILLEDFPDAEEVNVIIREYFDFATHIARTLDSILKRLGCPREAKISSQRGAIQETQETPDAPLFRLIEAADAHT